jgi:hypothetical protein
MLNIAYITGRRDSCIQWFLDSLANQAEALSAWSDMRLIIVDRFLSPIPSNRIKCPIIHVRSKSNVWQGEHRLTTLEYFAAASARNTALCYAMDGVIAYVDDLSVLMPKWLASVKASESGNYICMGACKKVKRLNVENGIAKTWEDFPPGVDSRWSNGRDDKPVELTGHCLYGSSVSIPVKALENINGWDEDCDTFGMGGEDYIAGIMLSKQSWKIYFDRSMLIMESEEHHASQAMHRIIEGSPGSTDASQVMLRLALHGRDRAPNYFGEGGIAALRQKILSGGEFPVMKIPDRSWYTGKLLSDY